MMKHYTVQYTNKQGKKRQISVLSHSLSEALDLFNDTRGLLGVKEVLSIEPEKISKNS